MQIQKNREPFHFGATNARYLAAFSTTNQFGGPAPLDGPKNSIKVSHRTAKRV